MYRVKVWSMIYETIKQELARRGWSGYRLAKESGLKARTIQDYLAGTTDMKASRLDQVFKALNLELRPKTKSKRQNIR